jgi:hypothetical protein
VKPSERADLNCVLLDAVQVYGPGGSVRHLRKIVTVEEGLHWSQCGDPCKRIVFSAEELGVLEKLCGCLNWVKKPVSLEVTGLGVGLHLAGFHLANII